MKQCVNAMLVDIVILKNDETMCKCYVSWHCDFIE